MSTEPGLDRHEWESELSALEPELREHARAPGARPDERDRDAEPLLDELHVAARRIGERGEVGDVVQRLVPTRQHLVDRTRMVEVALVGGKLLGLTPVAKGVARADGELVEGGKDVELRQRERRDAVDADRVAQRDEVEPAAAPVTPGDRPELASGLANALLL